MSLGNETVIAAAVAQATSAVVQPHAKKESDGGQQKMRACLPYEQRIDLPGELHTSLKIHTLGCFQEDLGHSWCKAMCI